MNYSSTRAAEQGDDFLRAAEAADAVQDRHQFFVWLRLHLHRFVPHELALCRLTSGSPGDAGVALVFHSVPLAEALIAGLKQPQGGLWALLISDWVFHGRQEAVLPLLRLETVALAVADSELRLLHEAGYSAALVLGLDSGAGVQPEAMFAFLLKEKEAAAIRPAMASLLLPHLYLMAVRALQADGSRRSQPAAEQGVVRGAALTQRELQILCAVREARHNAEIGHLLGITSATVKNHLRKIMRKLGAGNRAQAVAEAMKRRLIV